MTYATVNVDVEVDLSDVDTKDLIRELKNREYIFEHFNEVKEVLEQIYLKRIFGLDYLNETDKLIYLTLGRII